MHSEIQATSDIINGADPAAVVGVDENRTVPPILHPNSESSTSNMAQRENVQTDVTDNEALVKMVVMDGIVMGPQHGALGNCTADLASSQGGVFAQFIICSMGQNAK